MFNSKNDIFDIDLVKLIGLFISKLWIIILVTILGGVGSFAYSTYMIEPEYESSVLVYVNNSNINVGGTSVSVTTGDLSASKSLVSTYIIILKTRNTLDAVIKKADLDMSYEKLSRMISASAVNSTEIFKITVKNTDPKLACNIVNTIAEVFPDKVANIVNGTSAKIVEYGVVNTQKVAPSRTKYTAIGGLIGAFVVCAFIVIQELLDNSIHDENYLTFNFNYPVLGSIPNLLYGIKNINKYSKKSQGPYSNGNKNNQNEISIIGNQLHFDAKEAYKLLRTNIQFALTSENDEDTCKVLGITSSIRGEGKSTTACNLAYTIAQNNKRVLLIDGDMRLPSISTKLNVKNKYGLSDYIVGEANVNDVIYRYQDEMPNFHVLLSGTIPPNPSELLGSKAMAKFINSLKASYDYIVLDLPPVNIVTDALVTKDYVDGIIVTIREDFSIKGEVCNCINSIEFLDAKLLGFVLTNVKEGKTYYKPNYGYRKYAKYGYKKYSRYDRYYRSYSKGYEAYRRSEQKKENNS